jgi:hypothetical protein
MNQIIAQVASAVPSSDVAEILKVSAAFLGFSLGLINFAYLIYKEVIRKPKLIIAVEDMEVCARNEGEIDFQCALRLTAKSGDIHLLDVWLEHREAVLGEYHPTNRSEFVRAMPYTKRKLLALSADEFSTHVIKGMEKAIYIRDLHLAEGQTRSLTFAERLITERLSDGYEDFPLNGWTLHATFSDQHVSVVPNITIHSNSETGFITTRA